MAWFSSRTAAKSVLDKPGSQAASAVRRPRACAQLLARAQERRAKGDLAAAQTLAKEALDQGPAPTANATPPWCRSCWSTPASSTSAWAGPPASRSTTAPSACAA